MDECEWVQCIDPPIPAGANIKHTWDGVTPYEFGANATYECASTSLWFEQDRQMQSFNVTCLPGGRWQVPNPWPRCVPSKL